MTGVRSRWLVWPVALTTTTSLLVGVPVAGAAAAWQPAKPADAAGVRTAGAAAAPGRPAWSAEARAVRGPQPVTWPAPGSATADLTAGSAQLRAGTLPVRVGRIDPEPDGSAVPSAGTGRVTVQVADRAATGRAGVSGVLLAVSAADRRTGRIWVEVDYSGFGHGYGGDYASRLRLVRLPDCALTTPERTDCQRGTPVATRNDLRGQTLTAELDLGASAPIVLAAAAGPAGDNGDYTATSLAPAAMWQVSTQTGDFSWSLPLRMPPAPGGRTPSIGLAYSSGSVDGRVSTTNNQGSWAGDGWTSWPGFIERSYAGCTDDNPSHPTGDLCWLSENATLSLDGHAGELIKAGAAWRLKDDDGTRIELLTDAARGNGDNDNEYWKVTTTDGTQYYFGYHRLPNWDASRPVTDSTWTVPVYGNDAGEPCHATTFAASYCQQAWRWNLDYIVDPHGNTQALFYGKETGAYGRDNTPNQRTGYDRGGFLGRIEYGTRQGTEYAQAAPLRVVFTTAERCLSACWSGSAWTSDPNASAWPDSPWDQYCKAAPCTAVLAPTFWSARRLTRVTTQVRNGTSSYADVDSWTLRQEFLNAGNGEGTPLWLRGITHTGHVATAGGVAVSEPEISFDPGAEPLPNRVDGASVSRSALNRWRIKTVTNESGGQLQVTYSPASDCSRGSLPDPATNGTRCMPSYYDAGGTPALDWFHKYVVLRVDQDDIATDQPTQVTFYDYLDPAAWHYTTDEITKDKYRTWNQWRGYGQVRVRRGDPTGQQTAVEYRFLRGMDGDKAPGGVRDVQVTDSWGGTIEDHEALLGFLLEQITYDGPGGAEVGSTVHRPWRNGPTATRTRNDLTTQAWMVETGTSRTRTALAAGGFRTTQTVTGYNSDGLVTSVDDLGDENVSGDETCTRTWYARNDTTWMIDRVSETETLSVGCTVATTPAAQTTVLSRKRNYYDNDATLGAAPGRGDLVRTEELDRWDGDTPGYVTIARTRYDEYGRGIESTDARGHTTVTTYTTVHGGLVSQTSVANPRGHTVTTTVEPAWGSPTRIAGANNVTGTDNDVTDLTYDGLGRLGAVWLPGRRKGSQSASMRFAYLVRNGVNQPTAVTTEGLLPSGGYEKAIRLYDGWLRLRQTQTQATGGGRTLTDTHHDAVGNAARETAAYYDATNAPPGTSLAVPQQTVPGVTQHVYDGTGRRTASILLAHGQERWRTTTVHAGDRTHNSPPAGGIATTERSDARGRMVELRQYRDPARVGSTQPEDSESTTYGYDPTGALTSIQGAAGNRWTFGYDLRGRRTSSTDPDRGATTSTYDTAGNLESTRDALGRVLWYTYDKIGRKTSVRDGSASGPARAEWVYDTLPYGKGRLTSATRRAGGAAYTSRVDAYDPHGRPTATSVVLPTTEGALCAAGGATPCVYTTTTSYKTNGAVYQTTLPAAGNLPAERMTFGYTDVGDPNTLISDLANYVYAVTYNKLGQLTQRQLGRYGYRVALTSRFDEPSRRLTGQLVELEAKPDAADYTYANDAVGNVTAISDAPQGQTPDNQCYRYDHLRRLTDAWTPASGDCAVDPTVAGLPAGPASYWQKFTYDLTGNRSTQTTHTAAGETRYAYTSPTSGPESVRPHTVTSVRRDGPGGTTWTGSYTYDDAGNTTTRPSATGNEQRLSWDSEQRLSAVEEAGALTTFLYDADGNRLIRIDANGTRTLYLPGGTEVRAPGGAGTAVGTRYYAHAGTQIGMRTSAGVTWLIGDHHGTAELAINAGDLSVAKSRTTPFGDERGGPSPGWPTAMDKGFVGGTLDPTGLIHLGAREYDAATGRFLTVDPIINPREPQQMHGYAYGNNAPPTVSDPDGLCWPAAVCRLWENTKSGVRDAWNAVASGIERAWQATTSFVEDAWEWTKSTAKKAWEGVKTAAKKAWEWTKNAAKKTWQWTKTAAKKTWGGIKTGARKTWQASRLFINVPSTLGGTSWAIRQGATCTWNWDHMMSICTGASGGYGRGGMTIGSTFITGYKTPDDRVLRHEEKHADQYAIFGGAYLFPAAYGIAEWLSGGVEKNPFERWAGLEDGCYIHRPGC